MIIDEKKRHRKPRQQYLAAIFYNIKDHKVMNKL